MNRSAWDDAASTSRRDFVKSSTLAVVGAAGAGISSSAAAQTAPTVLPTRTRKSIDVDVLVCGGGCAGTAAALSAARLGVSTLLIEKAPFAGGIITSVGLPYFDGIADIKDNRIVVRGIALELLSKTGVCAANATHTSKHNPTIPNTFEFKCLLDTLLKAQSDRLQVLFNSTVCDVLTSGGRIQEVVIANKDGMVGIRPKVVIDCTGDADVAAWAGAPFEQNAEVQPLTLHFRIGHVRANPDLRKNCKEALAKAQAQGELPYYYGPGIMFLYAADEIYIHGIRVPANPTDAADLSRAEMQGRADALAMFKAWKRDVPGFEEAYFLEAYPWIGVRESRRIVGQYVLNEDDLMQSRRFDDAIATGCWYLDLHPNKTTLGSANDFNPEKVQPAPYDIPHRSLLPQQIENLLVAGRCHSATRGAHASTRVTVTAMAMGEAAGTSAALSLSRKTTPAELSGVVVRETLAQHGGGPFTA
ncbi:FAD-dependent oxidoreductase [Planctomicrobium piriforme]|uniref:FAD dependent oxidoreductase n=1 Tax=Planctomicrobium piriforme TaxID=1576369 RepID=A0A1I3KY72_9PLAN|nr:FAD-dependent oxidoreductase [Planctomicrobium piriforme]SFI77449.1 FAD dependent oxidoreductase [Planctomicrobium piriforme]